jgi:DNA-binding NarL/FixJ family response regulator/class 3 adenylate cyclase
VTGAAPEERFVERGPDSYTRGMLDLPRGVVTFLFTDIEGSTGILARLGEAYGDVLLIHRTMIREAVADHGGVVVDCRGDEFFASFGEAADAARAAAEAQRRIATHGWPEGAEVRVRMGLHTGTPELSGDGYFGLDVHRAARISQAARGGEVFVSATTRALLEDDHVEDLGEHELKGLQRPEQLYRLTVPGMPPVPAALPGTADVRESASMRVVIADDSVLLREGIVRLLEETGFDVVGQAGNADDLLLRVRSYKPQVAIVDIRMPPTHTDEGLRAAQEIREKHPETGVLVLSQYLEPGYAMELLAESAEGVGYLLKDRVADVTEFAAAVRRVGEGGSALDPAIVSQLVGRSRRDDPLDDLTPREREVLELMAEGKSNRAIAESMVVTERAVEKHVTSIFAKLRLPASADDHRRVLAVLAYLHTP